MARLMTRLLSGLLLLIGIFSSASADLSPPDPQRLSAANLKPRYDARVNASFDKFRMDLLATIKTKDSDALLAIVADDIRLSFGDTNGKDAFVNEWKPADPDSKVWAVLNLVVQNGGTFKTPTQFVAPYVYAIFPEDRDAFEFVSVVPPTAKLLAEPKADAEVVVPLNYDIVQLLDFSQLKSQHECTDADWLKVKTDAGQEGYVMCRQVRSPVDYRAFFEKKGDAWMMTTLIAGD
jgi:hypothetical protein